jgi:very-short-patch-repair endonuclease
MVMSALSEKFYLMWLGLGGPALETELRFDPTRRWRFDYAHPASKTAVEIEGGVFIKGRHTNGVGIQKDMEKYNKATLLGWKVFRLGTSMVTTPNIEEIIKFTKGKK